jgi:hypothetical protein
VKVINNDELNQIVEVKLKAGLRDQLKRFATEFIKDRDPYSVMKGMQAAAEYVEKGQDLIIVKVNQGVLIFSLLDRTEAQWVEDAQNLSKKNLPTPRKVLIRMVMARMEKIRDQYNNYIKEVIKRSGRTPPQFPEFDSRQSVEDCKAMIDSSGMGRHFKTEFAELQEDLLQRSGADDELVKEAWDLLIARKIHES